MRRRGFTRTAAVVAVAMVIVSFFVYVAIQPAIGSPDESRRITHPKGFSIIEPKGWEAHVDVAGQNGAVIDSIRFLPVKAMGVPGSFHFVKLPGPPDPAKLAKYDAKPIKFDGHPAYEMLSPREKTREHTRTVTYQVNGAWYELSVTRPEVEPVEGSPWEAYFESAKAAPAAPAQTPTLTLAGPTLNPASN
ncbi:MAG: hypothetical protein ACTHM6_14725 [Tepidisphaeraceae bacterium]